MPRTCTAPVSQEDYADFIVRYRRPEEVYDKLPSRCIDFVDRDYAIAYVPLADVEPIRISAYTYTAIPKLYTLLDTTSMESSGFDQVSRQPALGLRGQGVMIGLIDTGIDYTNPLFLTPDDTTRLLGIWDQTIGTDADDSGITSLNPPEGILYGHEFTPDQINEALRSDDPLAIVPSRDIIGHGTFLAGIAAGGATADGNFYGAAPEAYLGIVKLKPAKQYLRNFYDIRTDAIAYQENDIMMGVKYLKQLALSRQVPLVICIGLGTNQGGHDGTAPLGLVLGNIGNDSGVVTVVAAGNETGYRHHYLGTIAADARYDDVEIRVANDETGFSLELWALSPELYTVGFLSPTGEAIARIPVSSGKENRFSFLLEETTITVNYQTAEVGSGSQLVFMQFEAPTPGIWHVLVYNSLFITGQFHMWLPVRGFISDETYFLKSDPDVTITDPGNALLPITVSAYNHTTSGIYIHSSRGFTRTGRVKPDLAAPGVDVYGPGIPSDTWIYQTGTSIAAAHVAGAAASLLTWGILRGNDTSVNTSVAKSYLIRGAKRNPALTYPSKEWGYGTLDLYQTFLSLRE